MAALGSLPYELQNNIISLLRRPHDLLHLALVNKQFKNVIIPEHLEYRFLIISNYSYYEEVFKHLSDPKSRHLAERIHTVVFRPQEAKHFHTKMIDRLTEIEDEPLQPEDYPYGGIDVFPRSFLHSWNFSHTEQNGQDDWPIHRALAQMVNLESFYWVLGASSWKARNDGVSGALRPSTIFRILQKSQNLRTLSVELVDLPGEDPKVKNISFPLWSVNQMTTLVLAGWEGWIWEKGSPLTQMLKNCRCLENLDLDFSYGTPLCLENVVLPKLQRLRLHAKGNETPAVTEILTQFFAAHPLLIKLDCFLYRDYTSSLTPSSFPNLVEVIDSDALVLAFASSHKAGNPQRPLKSIEFSGDKYVFNVLVASGDNMPGLRRVVLNDMSKYSLEELGRLGQAFPELEELEIGLYSQFAKTLDEYEAAGFFRSFSSLLSLSCCIGFLPVPPGSTVQEEYTPEEVVSASRAILDKLKVVAPTLRRVWISKGPLNTENAKPVEGTVWIRAEQDGEWTVQGTKGGRKAHYKEEDPGNWIRERWDTGFLSKVRS